MQRQKQCGLIVWSMTSLTTSNDGPSAACPERFRRFDHVLEQCPSGEVSLDLSDSQGQSSVVVTLSKHLPYPGDSSCNLTINAPWADGLLFVVRMINMRWDNSRCLDHMELSDKKQVLLAPLCSARAIGTRFVAIPEKQVTLEVKTHPSTPSRNYTGLNLAFTGYVNEIHCDLDQMFLCQKTRVCIFKTLLCDQVDHCGDRSDEPQDCEYHGQQTWVDWAPLLSWCVLFALFGGAFFRVYCRKRRLQLKDQ